MQMCVCEHHYFFLCTVGPLLFLREEMMSHVMHEWVMPHVNVSCHTWMCQVTCEWVISHVNESCHMWNCHVTCEWVMSQCFPLGSLVKKPLDRNESTILVENKARHTREWVMWQVNVACHSNESRNTYMVGCRALVIWGLSLQHTATHCKTMQHTATHCNTPQHAATRCFTLKHTATHCNTMQHTATRCN